ncbi:SMP-30/gluconolactonase/LRE family protein [Acinetobacter sp. MD2(2019)]|uniref:SMP-30/gluconolactonase/LRE family protein n=1 Tax=Acinetobacter sp. MD2(2019) TaxID=2605273 RepID=UPI002D1EBA1D|nr:SMP-30/gluconolactonase/LRE family protein [Acinetobacter sp. MD2(2019)]MEB3752759.1 SMP-30/gluconolactonase/LRE family protein [Acinetobacter sp. MD2(2019)]
MEIKVLVDIKTRLGEGATWDPIRQRLFWVDIVDKRLFSCDEFGGNLRAWHAPQKIGSFALRDQHDGAILALEDGLYTLDFNTGDVEFLISPEPDKPFNRLNDGRVDRQGRYVFGSMNRMEEDTTAALYRLNTDLSLETLETGINTSNSICWSPDGSKFYYADTWAGEIWSYDYAMQGLPTNKQVFCQIDTSDGGSADGSTVDSEGFVWNAKVYSGQLIRYAPNGQVDRVIEMPVKKITTATFGGKNLDVLYVTSMSEPPLPRFPGDNQYRGSVFAIYGLGIQGVEDTRFKG